MKKNKKIALKDAFWKSPGPDTPKSAAILTLKGLFMGTADIIPGVSGGTIALITGIYAQLIAAIKSVNMKMLRCLLKLDINGALSELHIRFLIFLFIGIGTALISFSRIMHFLLHDYPVYTWGLFFGLIAASILVVGKKVEKWSVGPIALFIIGAVFGFVIVGLVPVSTPNEMWFIFISGFIAICAMILPGISGAFILLILGKYEFITATLKNPFIPSNILVIIVFCIGCVLGLLCFSRILSFFLSRYYSLTVSCLAGLMAGSMRKIWPWKEIVEQIVIANKIFVLDIPRIENTIPPVFDVHVITTVLLMIVGFIAVIALERLSRQKTTNSS